MGKLIKRAIANSGPVGHKIGRQSWEMNRIGVSKRGIVIWCKLFGALCVTERAKETPRHGGAAWSTLYQSEHAARWGESVQDVYGLMMYEWLDAPKSMQLPEA